MTTPIVSLPVREGGRCHKHLYSLQMLRGIAALLVVFHHVDGKFQIHHIFWTGFIGVDLFFILSGFLMVQVHFDDLGIPRRAISFAAKRLVRIFPLYWIVLCVIVLTCYRFIDNPSPGTPSFLSLFGRSFFLLPSCFGFSIPNWTLSHELWFYTMFMMGILLPLEPFLLLAGAVCLGSLILLGFQLAGVVTVPPGVLYGFLLSPFNLEFATGGLVALAIRHKLMRYGRFFLVAGILSLLVVVPYGLHMMRAPPSPESLLRCYQVAVFGIPMAMTLYGLVSLELTSQMHPPRFLVFLGDASYSIYLTHAALLIPIATLALKLNLQAYLIEDTLDIYLALAAVFGGCLVYLIIEKPLLTLLRRKLVRILCSVKEGNPTRVC